MQHAWFYVEKGQSDAHCKCHSAHIDTPRARSGRILRQESGDFGDRSCNHEVKSQAILKRSAFSRSVVEQQPSPQKEDGRMGYHLTLHKSICASCLLRILRLIASLAHPS